jgi:hypothetical protein
LVKLLELGLRAPQSAVKKIFGSGMLLVL